MLNGVDYVEVVAAPAGGPPTQLRVTFVNPLTVLPDVTQVQVAGGERIPTVAVTAVDATDDPRTALVTLVGSGDLSPYEVRLVRGITDPAPPRWVDPVLAGACFSFGLACASGLPCDDGPVCPPAAGVEPRLDYLARDWESLRTVLLDRMSVLQPDWTQRRPADIRMVIVELLAELGDRASYRLDAIGTEAYIGTARRRISVRRHARLVDYVMSDGRNARAWVALAVPEDVLLTSGGSVPVVPAGTRLLTGGVDAPSLISVGSPAEAAARRAGALDFQALSQLDVVAGAHSAMRFHTWSGARPGLPAGATAATLVGHLPELAPGQVLILVENRDPAGPRKAVEDADPARRQAVRLTAVVATDGTGPLRDELTGTAITEITWHAGDALAFPLTISGEVPTAEGGVAEFADGALALGNVLLADHGRREPPETLGPVPATGRLAFRLAHGPLSQVPRQLIVSALPGGTGTREELVPFDPAGSAASAVDGAPAVILPDLRLHGFAPQDGSPLDGGTGVPWNVQLDLLHSDANRDVVVEVDDDGVAWLRFGREENGVAVNGRPPASGDVLLASYRTGNGTVGNVGAGALRTVLDDGSTIAAALRAVLADPGVPTRVWNPLPARGGTEPESVEQVRQRAPVAFRRQERAVTADDYARRAEQFGSPGPALIQRAVATIRWTGSWHVVVVAVDPIGGEDADPAFLAETRDYLDGYRMAGHDLQVVGARYAALEVGLAVRVAPDHRRDLVRAELGSVMSNRRRPDGSLGLFHPDRLTFGMSVYLGPILAAAQTITGVARVEATRFSRYRLPATDARAGGRIEIGPREIARLDNDPNRPERGRFFLDLLEGGR